MATEEFTFQERIDIYLALQTYAAGKAELPEWKRRLERLAMRILDGIPISERSKP